MAFGTLIEHNLSVAVLAVVLALLILVLVLVTILNLVLILLILILILILIIHILSLSPNIFLNTPGKGTFTIHKEGYMHSVLGSDQIIREVILYIAAN